MNRVAAISLSEDIRYDTRLTKPPSRHVHEQWNQQRTPDRTQITNISIQQHLYLQQDARINNRLLNSELAEHIARSAAETTMTMVPS